MPPCPMTYKLTVVTDERKTLVFNHVKTWDVEDYGDSITFETTDGREGGFYNINSYLIEPEGV